MATLFWPHFQGPYNSTQSLRTSHGCSIQGKMSRDVSCNKANFPATPAMRRDFLSKLLTHASWHQGWAILGKAFAQSQMFTYKSGEVTCFMRTGLQSVSATVTLDRTNSTKMWRWLRPWGYIPSASTIHHWGILLDTMPTRKRKWKSGEIKSENRSKCMEDSFLVATFMFIWSGLLSKTSMTWFGHACRFASWECQCECLDSKRRLGFFWDVSCHISHVSLAAQNREPQIARFPESRAWNRQKIRSEVKQIDSESPSEP